MVIICVDIAREDRRMRRGRLQDPGLGSPDQGGRVVRGGPDVSPQERKEPASVWAQTPDFARMSAKRSNAFSTWVVTDRVLNMQGGHAGLLGELVGVQLPR
jgi:hypothetical protein